uniref:Uncharacterized protein n=1 Tax=Oryza nivara TaxID=4536 RepID=A0A0E0HM36_ORYNI
MDGETLSWAEPECGDEFALCFLDEAACAAVSGAISTVSASRTGSPSCAWRGRRVPPPETVGVVLHVLMETGEGDNHQLA